MAKSRAVAVRRSRSYYRPKRRRGHRSKFSLPIAVVAGFAPTAIGVWNNRSSGTAMVNYLKESWTGLDASNNFNFAGLRNGLLPAVMGGLVHMIAGRLGLNRMIAKAGIPLIRV